MSSPGYHCRGCGGGDIAESVTFFRQPLASRFKRTPGEADEFCDLSLVVCRSCGLVQLRELPSPAALRPRFDWLRYNEPEAHLDAVAGVITGIAAKASPVAGLTYKDNSLLQRLSKMGFGQVRLDISAKVLAGVPSPWGVETVAGWVCGTAGTAVRDAGVVVARHVLEHCEAPLQAVRSMLSWLAPGGRLVIEVPGCSEALRSGTPELIWEEHASYFTEASLRALLESAGAEIFHFSPHPYPFESSLVAIVGRGAEVSPVGAAPGEVETAVEFGRKAAKRAQSTRDGLRQRRDAGCHTVIFGAGHLSCAFVSMSETADCIDCVLDDTPQKQGLFLAGTHLPIVSPAGLKSCSRGLCLMAVHPSAETRVFERLAPLRSEGWETRSIFQDSPYGIDWS